MKNFIVSMLTDERGSTSSKRVIGFICGLSLCITMFINGFTKSLNPDPILVNAVLTLACVSLGATTFDKFSAMIKGTTTPTPTVDTTQPTDQTTPSPQI